MTCSCSSFEWHRLTDSSIPPKGQIFKFNKDALKNGHIEAVTRLNNEEMDFSKVRAGFWR
jgi:hypothetical protein